MLVEVLLFELEDADAFLAVGFGFGGAVGVDAAFGEEVGSSAGDDQSGPAIATLSTRQSEGLCLGVLSCEAANLGWRYRRMRMYM